MEFVGWSCEDELQQTYRIPKWEQFKAKIPEDMKKRLHGLVRRARVDKVPNNSQIRATLQLFGQHLAHETTDLIEVE